MDEWSTLRGISQSIFFVFALPAPFTRVFEAVMSNERLLFLLVDGAFLCRVRVVGAVVCRAGATTASVELRSTLAALRVRCDLLSGSACPLLLPFVCVVPFMLGVRSGDRGAPMSLLLSLLLLFLKAGDGESCAALGDFGVSWRENTREGVEGRDKGIELGIRISRGPVLGGRRVHCKAQAENGAMLHSYSLRHRVPSLSCRACSRKSLANTALVKNKNEG